jgi:hypothetical protein
VENIVTGILGDDTGREIREVGWQPGDGRHFDNLGASDDHARGGGSRVDKRRFRRDHDGLAACSELEANIYRFVVGNLKVDAIARDALKAGSGNGEVASARQKKKNVPTAFIVRAGALRDPRIVLADGDFGVRDGASLGIRNLTAQSGAGFLAMHDGG